MNPLIKRKVIGIAMNSFNYLVLAIFNLIKVLIFPAF